MEWFKTADVSIHVVATGAGAGLQNTLWGEPGCSAYFSGASFPYAKEEQEELLGFMPTQFCSEEAAVDLASAAYMKAYKFGGKQPVGVGIAASVTSNKLHRGDHRIFAVCMTDTKVVSWSISLPKGSKDTTTHFRLLDGDEADLAGLHVLDEAFIDSGEFSGPLADKMQTHDATELANARFFEHPFFTSNGRRLHEMPAGKHWALMSGAYNPPHLGHFGMAEQVWDTYNRKAVFEITAEPPHKDALTVQDMLKRAKLLQGYDRLFTRGLGLYLDKARAYPRTPIVMGADAMVRLFDPKWGKTPAELITEFYNVGTDFYVAGRQIDGKFVVAADIISMIHDQLDDDQRQLAEEIILPIDGRWDISSTELRNKRP